MDQEDPNDVTVYIAVPAALQEEIENLVRLATETPTFKDGEGFAADERAVYGQTDRLGDKVIGKRLHAVAESHEIREEGRRLNVGRVKAGADS